MSVQQKTPRAMRQARGARRCDQQAVGGRPASADALSKYENSGAHGTDPLPVAGEVSSGWDGRLII
ncbi:hypothetical protein AC230_18165 [Streptomyces caatingaensis]|uniref:Uncharacterized protein n=1 Tax=Streptomyces caatingaensis TaxID=1678637 RepID=A0A0K9XCV5_9ACTN|nr:hypothetical protein AC230_18165 [Streptomyces caatingaensis]